MSLLEQLLNKIDKNRLLLGLWVWGMLDFLWQ
jgi:hypothetical protein